MHPDAMIFCLETKKKFPSWPADSQFHNSKVLDCGSLDRNGNNRYLFTGEYKYIGVDLVIGRNVDVVGQIHKFWGGDEQYDCVISTEMLEHDEYWKESIAAMIRFLRPGGLFIMTCGGPNRPEHGTVSRTPDDSPMTNNYYGNLSEPLIRAEFDVDTIFSEYEFKLGRYEKDLYFYGVKALN